MEPCIRGHKARFFAPILIVGAAAASPAFAQALPPEVVPPPRSIVIIRDVPQRPAFDPGEPGRVHTVGVAPIETIFGVTDQMVNVLSDDETSTISAGLDAHRGALGAIIGGSGLLPEQQQIGGGPGAPATGALGGLGGTITNTIGTATASIGRALAPLSSLGGAN